MFVFETVAHSEPEARRISDAFYRFLDRHSDQSVDGATMHVERKLDGERITIQLWSAKAVAAYRRQLMAAPMARA